MRDLHAVSGWLLDRDRHGRLRLIPNRRTGMVHRFGRIKAQVDREMVLIDLPDARRLSPCAAIIWALHELTGVWPWVGRFLAIPLGHQAEEGSYCWVPAQRGRLARRGMAPACDDPLEDYGLP